MNWQETDAKCKVEAVGLASEKRRPVYSWQWHLVSGTVLDT